MGVRACVWICVHAFMGVHGCVMVKYECVRERKRGRKRESERVREIC